MPRLLWHEVRHELLPFDGRLATAWRLGVICALTAMAFMIWQIPLVAIGCYLVLFVMKPDPGESTLMAIAICVLVSIVVALLFFLTRLSINTPGLRLIILAASAFVFLYIGSASKLGPVGGIIALVIGFVMTLLGIAPFGEVATRGILFSWLMTLIPMGLLVICNMLFGLSAPKLLKAELNRRLEIIDRILAGTLTPDAVWPVLRQGNNPVSSYLKFIAVFHVLPKAQQQRLKTQHERTLQMMLYIASVNSLSATPDNRQSKGITPQRKATLVRLREQLEQPVADGPMNPPDPFFRADALTNPRHYRFALKTTLAASLAYIIYTAMDWQDIHTAMVTCYVAALASTGETLHKLTLRIVGCLIGAAMGIASILLLMPMMTSIGELMLLVFAGTAIAGWVSSGSERIAYAGIQIGLAFLMTVLQGFGPDVQVSVAVDRVIGILLGNALLYVIFTRIWPTSSHSAARAGLSEVQNTLQLLAGNAAPGQLLAPSQAAGLLMALGACREQIAMGFFEPQSLKAGHEAVERLRDSIGATEALCVKAAVDPAWQEQCAKTLHQMIKPTEPLLKPHMS